MEVDDWVKLVVVEWGWLRMEMCLEPERAYKRSVASCIRQEICCRPVPPAVSIRIPSPFELSLYDHSSSAVLPYLPSKCPLFHITRSLSPSAIRVFPLVVGAIRSYSELPLIHPAS